MVRNAILLHAPCAPCLMRMRLLARLFFTMCVVAVPPARAQMLGALSYAKPHPAVVRVVVPEADGTAYGSGTLIDIRDDYGLVLTNWHVVRGASGPIEVLFPSGFTSQARSLKMDSDWDLAALVIWRPPCEPVRLATRPPRPGDPLTICGYGAGNYRAVTGRCTQFYAPRLELPQELVELDVQARQGDSGGPIFNDRGELAGVLFGAGEGTTLGSFEGRVKTFLTSLAPDIGHHDGAPQVALKASAGRIAACPTCPNRHAGSICKNGTCRPTSDLGEVCLGCETVAEHDRRTSPPSARPSPAADDWPKTDGMRPQLQWSAGKPAVTQSKSKTWPTFENDMPVARASGTTAATSPTVSLSLFENIKNGLAVVGALAILLQLIRLAG
jgi:hypothetical protein